MIFATLAGDVPSMNSNKRGEAMEDLEYLI
jgi:hypothetical protein